MASMNKDDIVHLARLSRIALTPTELERFEAQISSILEYVSTVNKIAGDGDGEPQVGHRYNVFRTDMVTNESEQYTETLLAAAPERRGRYVAVKKILQIDE